MSYSPIRKDKTCLNCRHVVDQRYCPNCGQENTDSRKTFHHLFIHFFEDLTHYENAFWRTIKNLLFRPASLTKEYLSGKRLSYLAPVRLYIFISFITFFLIAVLPETADPSHLKKKYRLKPGYGISFSDSNDTLKNDEIKDAKVVRDSAIKTRNIKLGDAFSLGYKSIEELDSIQKFGKPDDQLDDLQYWVVKKMLTVRKNNTSDELFDKFKESFIRNFPKALFIYLPLFAFFLWIFHGKRRWYYFEHGIFTLHYFSFLLLITLLVFLLNRLTDLCSSNVIDTFSSFITFAAYVWMFSYFFPAHHRFYGETRTISFLKSSILFFINMIFIFIILILFAIYTFINLH